MCKERQDAIGLSLRAAAAGALAGAWSVRRERRKYLGKRLDGQGGEGHS